MSGVIKSALADVWYLLVILAVIALVVVYKIVVGEEAAPVVQKPGAAGELAAFSDFPPPTAAPPKRLSEEEKARGAIASHQTRLDEDPTGKDAPALLFAIGNLNKQKLRDFKEAARNYELLIKDFPDWVGIAAVYPQLISCYELLEDKESLRWLYNQMIEKFGPDTNEYKYASAKLNS